MSLESFSRLSQSIKDAAEAADPEVAKARAAVAVNSIGSMSVPRRTERPTAFSKAVDTLGDAIKAARGAKQPVKPEAKTLAELLAESAQDSE